MKITMYELLGMVKDGKKLPKKVKVLDVIYEFDDHYGDYFNEPLGRYLFVYMTSEEEWKLSYFLNIQVEILEEEKKIPEKFKINYEIDEENTINLKPATMLECDLACRINEILDYLKSKGE